VFTVGHSTRTLDELVDLVCSHGVDLIADVRKIPRSRRHPHFDAVTLPAALGAAGLGYRHLPGLGGFRRERPDSINRAWRNPSFRAYADYMQTPEFAAELDRLLELGRAQRVAIMCAEAYWLRCHRSLIADALVGREEPILHIVSADRAEPHRLRDFARVDDGRVSYPGQPELFEA
jgi:uncharacterized protein (DUF488 family)